MRLRLRMMQALIPVFCVAAVLLSGTEAFAQFDAGTTTTHGTRGIETATVREPQCSDLTCLESQILAMRRQLEQQQAEIDQLRHLLQSRDRGTTLAQSASEGIHQHDLPMNATADADKGHTVQSALADAGQAALTTPAVVQEKQHREAVVPHPEVLRYKGVTLTPGGFLAGETVYRQRATGGGLATAFNSIPFSSSAFGQQSEFVASGRQSRLSLGVEGRVEGATLGGYYEVDFLSAGTTSNSNASNSYTLRQRQLWARYQRDRGFTVVGGQMWSLLTLTTKGLENRSEAVPLTIDPQYTPGYIWARQYELRVYDNFFDRRLFAGVALENPQMTFGGHGYSNNFIFGSTGNSSGLFNPSANYSFNMAPDIIAKVAVEPGFGHYEIAGIATFMRDRIYPHTGAPTNTGAGAYNDVRTAGAVEAAAWLPLGRGLLNVGVRGLYGEGVGRYGSSGLPDTTVRPDGKLAPIRNLVMLGSLEFHPGKWDFYYYYGGDYAGRNWSLNANGQPVGYGSPLFDNSGCAVETAPVSSPYAPGIPMHCTADTRAVIAHDLGFWYSFYKGRGGKLQIGMQYDYLQRKTWAGMGGQPKAVENMFWTSFRYYLP